MDQQSLALSDPPHATEGAMAEQSQSPQRGAKYQFIISRPATELAHEVVAAARAVGLHTTPGAVSAARSYARGRGDMPPLTKEEEAINRTRGNEARPGKNKQRRSPQEIAARREFVLAHSELPDRELLALAKKEGVHLKLHHVYYLRRLIKDGTLKKPKGKPGPKARAAAADLAPAPRAPRAAIVQPPSGRQDLEMQLLHAAFEIGFPTAMRLIADAQTVVAPALQSFLQNRK